MRSLKKEMCVYEDARLLFSNFPKKTILQQFYAGKSCMNIFCPASRIQPTGGRLTYLLDKEAARQLSHQES